MCIHTYISTYMRMSSLSRPLILRDNKVNYKLDTSLIKKNILNVVFWLTHVLLFTVWMSVFHYISLYFTNLSKIWTMLTFMVIDLFEGFGYLNNLTIIWENGQGPIKIDRASSYDSFYIYIYIYCACVCSCVGGKNFLPELRIHI